MALGAVQTGAGYWLQRDPPVPVPCRAATCGGERILGYLVYYRPGEGGEFTLQRLAREQSDLARAHASYGRLQRDAADGPVTTDGHSGRTARSSCIDFEPWHERLDALDKTGDFSPGFAENNRLAVFDLVRVEVHMHGASVYGDNHPRRIAMRLRTTGFTSN